MKNKKLIYLGLASVVMGSHFVPTMSALANQNTESMMSISTNESVFLDNVISLKGQGVQGLNQWIYNGFDLKFDTLTKTINVENMVGSNYQFHNRFANEYISIGLYGQDGVLKTGFNLNGTDKTSKANELDGVSFEYGDYLEIYHAEADWRFKITGDVIDQTEDFTDGTTKETMSKSVFVITENGLRQVFENDNVISLRGQGVQGLNQLIYSGFDLTFDAMTKTINVENMVGSNYKFHDRFANEYISIGLYGQDGVLKTGFNLNGIDTTSKANELDGVSFEYGDHLEIYHRESDWRFKITGDVIDQTEDFTDGSSQQTVEFEITPHGLKQVK